MGGAVIAWTEEIFNLMGNISDHEIARRFGMSSESVRSKRNELGIPVWQKPVLHDNHKCSFPGCDKPHCAKGLCNSHWAQMNRGGPLRPIRTRETIEQRFWRYTEKAGPDECWEFIGTGQGSGKQAGGGKGYGQVYYKGKKYMAHRLSYELLIGPISSGMQLDHLCRNKKCVNPAHLQPVTQRENVKRMHAYHSMRKEILRLRKLIYELGGDPDANLSTLS